MKKIVSIFFALTLVLGVLITSASAQDAPASIKAGVLNGKAISMPKPAYPAEAKAAGIDGIVFVEVEIDETGKVVSAVAATEPRETFRSDSGETVVTGQVEAADPMLREAAEKAALEARFAPTLLSGMPVKVTGTIVYNFVSKAADPALKGGVLNGKAKHLPMPKYPQAAMAAQVEGTVVVKVTVDEGGSVIGATALSGHPLLRAAAVEAARGATFSPTRLEGKPARIDGVLTYNFFTVKKEINN